MNYFAFGIIPDTCQWNRMLWERVWTRKKIWLNFSLCLSSLVDHDPFLEGAFSQTWWFVDSYYIAPCRCTVAGLSSSSRALRLALLQFSCIYFFLICWHNKPCPHIVFLHPSAWKGTDKVLMVMLRWNSTSPLGEYSNTLSRFILLRRWWNRAVYAPLAVARNYQPYSQGPLSSSFEKVPRLQLVTCQCVQIITALWVGPRLVKSKVQLYPGERKLPFYYIVHSCSHVLKSRLQICACLGCLRSCYFESKTSIVFRADKNWYRGLTYLFWSLF